MEPVLLIADTLTKRLYEHIMFKLIFILLLISSPSFASDWSSEDTKRETVYLIFDAIDWAQTREIARNPDKWREQNSILGDHPSVGRVDGYFITAALLHVGIAYALPAEWRKTFQYVTIGFEGSVVAHNLSAGIQIKF